MNSVIGQTLNHIKVHEPNCIVYGWLNIRTCSDALPRCAIPCIATSSHGWHSRLRRFDQQLHGNVEPATGTSRFLAAGD